MGIKIIFRKFISSLAPLIFFCLFLLGLKLSFWQHSRYQEKLSIEQAFASPVISYAQFKALSQSSYPAYYPFSETLSLNLQKPIFQILNPQGRAYQIFCPVELDQEVFYFKASDLLELSSRELLDSRIKKFGLSNKTLRDNCEQFVSSKEKILAFIPVKKNIFIPKHQTFDKQDTVRHQMSEFIESPGMYLIEDPSIDFIAMSSSKHFGYALQWLFLSLVSFFFLIKSVFLKNFR